MLSFFQSNFRNPSDTFGAVFPLPKRKLLQRDNEFLSTYEMEDLLYPHDELEETLRIYERKASEFSF